MREKYIKNHSLSSRLETSAKILRDHPDKIPIICEPYDENDTKNQNCKYLAPTNILLSSFLVHVREKLNLNDDKPLFLYVNNECIDLNFDITKLYSKYKNEDNFLYIKYDFVRRDIQIPSVFNFLSEGTKIKLESNDKIFKVVKINWYYRKEIRYLHVGDFCLYRLLLLDNGEYQVRSKISFSDIENVEIVNNQLIISYKSLDSSYKDFYEDIEDSNTGGGGTIKNLQMEILKIKKFFETKHI